MKHQISIHDVDGKVIKSIVSSRVPYNDQVIINFRDNSFCCFGITWHDGDGTLEEQSLDYLNFGDKELVAAGIATDAEIIELKSRHDLTRDCRKFFNKAEG